MKIVVIGDTHADIDIINKIVKDYGVENVDLVLQVGDFGFWNNCGDWPAYATQRKQFLKPTWVIPGNHEDPAVTSVAEKLDIPNFLYMPEGMIKTFGSTTVMGVGGAYCVDNPSVKYDHDNDVFLWAIDSWKAAECPKIDILITHEAPKFQKVPGNPLIAQWYKIPPNITPGDEKLDILISAIKPTYHFNGHHHIWNVKESPDKTTLSITLPIAQEGYIVLDTEKDKLTRVCL